MDQLEVESKQLEKDCAEEGHVLDLINDAIHDRWLKPSDIRAHLIMARGILVLSQQRDELERAILCDPRFITKGSMGREYIQMVLGREFKI